MSQKSTEPLQKTLPPPCPPPRKKKKSLLNAVSTQTTEIELVYLEHVCAPRCGGWCAAEEADTWTREVLKFFPSLSAPCSCVLLSKGAERTCKDQNTSPIRLQSKTVVLHSFGKAQGRLLARGNHAQSRHGVVGMWGKPHLDQSPGRLAEPQQQGDTALVGWPLISSTRRGLQKLVHHSG